MRLIAAATAAVVATPALAQVSTVDEGSFTVTQNGVQIGREEFRIRRTPTGETSVNYVASATVSFGGRQLSPDLRTDTRGGLLAYRVEVRAGAETQERLKGALDRGLFTAVVSTPRGEAAREYVVSDGAVILDDDVFHQYYFIARQGERSSVAAVIPRRNVQVGMRLTNRGRASVTLGGRAVSATHFVLSEPNGATREVWADDEGRILKVAVPARGVVAERDEPPR